ncbi:uncharacterized protein LAJ45_08444 [Morchella importuna]|uniref:uncharacterized protein n=1 Tax=Morchella importuna TaxID=1174673 RepID=UPI001E8E020D|nr:uncharacterized protein LAJ45_08444 [Morchella importuna]KAH8147616.1 hypothetical protein LAJ45_08444 [Morchella importuna]
MEWDSRGIYSKYAQSNPIGTIEEFLMNTGKMVIVFRLHARICAGPMMPVRVFSRPTRSQTHKCENAEYSGMDMAQ